MSDTDQGGSFHDAEDGAFGISFGDPVEPPPIPVFDDGPVSADGGYGISFDPVEEDEGLVVDDHGIVFGVIHDEDADLPTKLEQAFNGVIHIFEVVPGGDVNEVYHLELKDGRRLFIKTNKSPPDGLYVTEARGLMALAATETVTVPKVELVAPDGSFLALQWIDQAPHIDSFDHDLGRDLARLHLAACDGFGLDHDNFIAMLPQDNTPADTWPEFYAERRLRPLVRDCVDRALLPREAAAQFESLFGKLDELCGPTEPPSLLHGDLWGGNMISDHYGSPAFIDPSVYGGHREVDLAMMQLFGGFDAVTFETYDEIHPRADGHEERLRLYQLYPLLVHALMFGGSYGRSVMSALNAYL